MPADETTSDPRRKRTRRKAPRRIDAAHLQRVALHYLERYSASSAQLRRVLHRRIVASCRHHGDDPDSFAAMLEECLARCASSGLLDDRRFAEARAATLRRKGRSARAISTALAAKGIERGLIAEASATSDEAELAAARLAARRKRLGPWSRTDRTADRQKQLAALARAGFAMAIGRAVIDGPGDES